MMSKLKKIKKLVLSPLGIIVIIGMALLMAPDAFAQSVTVDLGNDSDASTTGRAIQLIFLLTIISLAPSILVMTTSFTRIMIVFSIIRHALATNTTPPNTVLVGLALFMTAFIMAPTFEASWDQGIKPMIQGDVEQMEGLELATKPIHGFMLKNVREKDLVLFMNMSNSKVEKPEDTPLKALIPAFIISELKRAFEIGFLIFVPFVIIDMVIASVLMSMGMMMLPPTMLAMPFKLIFFVIVDGWYLLCGSLVQSFAT